MMKYTLFVKMMEDVFDARFVFEAKNNKEAKRKSFGWAMYQGMGASDVIVKKSQGKQLNWAVNNEYVE